MNLATGEAVVELHGDIFDDTEGRWFDDPLEAGIITPKAFREAMEPYENAPNILIHLNSYGGDLYAGIAIHNYLASLPGKTTVVIDSIAASAASIIAAGADELLVHPSSTYMVHEGYVMLYGAYTPDDLDKVQRGFESSMKAMYSIYTAKTGRPISEIEELVKNETYLVGEEIVMEGFADKVVNADLTDVEADLVKLAEDIESIRTEGEMDPENPEGEDQTPEEIDEDVEAELEAAQDVIEEITEAIEEAQEEKANRAASFTLADFQAKYPEIANAFIDYGRTAERDRIREIDSISSGLDPEDVERAKYTEPTDAKELAFQAMRARKSASQNVLKGMMADSKATSKVKAAVAPDPMPASDEEKRRAEIENAFAKAVKRTNARK